MTTDILHFQINGTEIDFDVLNQDLADDSGLISSVINSLFCERLIDPDQAPDGDVNDLRGWWADSFANVEDFKIGSRRWILYRDTITQDSLNLLIEFDTEALQHLITDGHALAIDIVTDSDSTRRGVMSEIITITMPNFELLKIFIEQDTKNFIPSQPPSMFMLNPQQAEQGITIDEVEFPEPQEIPITDTASTSFNTADGTDTVTLLAYQVPVIRENTGLVIFVGGTTLTGTEEPTPETVTFGGTPCEFITRRTVTSGGLIATTGIFYLLDPDNSSTFDIVATFNPLADIGQIYVAAVTVYNVSQRIPVDQGASETNSGTVHSYQGLAPDSSLILAAKVQANPGLPGSALGGAQSFLFDISEPNMTMSASTGLKAITAAEDIQRTGTIRWTQVNTVSAISSTLLIPGRGQFGAWGFNMAGAQASDGTTRTIDQITIDNVSYFQGGIFHTDIADARLRSFNFQAPGIAQGTTARIAVYIGGSLSAGPAGAVLLEDFGRVPTFAFVDVRMLSTTEAIIPAGSVIWMCAKCILTGGDDYRLKGFNSSASPGAFDNSEAPSQFGDFQNDHGVFNNTGEDPNEDTPWSSVAPAGGSYIDNFIITWQLAFK